MSNRIRRKQIRFWEVFRTFNGKWAFRACNIVSDGYDTREEALEAALTKMCERAVSRLELEYEIQKLRNQVEALKAGKEYDEEPAVVISWEYE